MTSLRNTFDFFGDLLTYVVFSIPLVSLISCVSIDLPPQSGKRSERVSFSPPPAPFALVEQDKVDRGWRNPKNGNTLSYFSECHSPADPTLEQIQRDVLANMNSYQIQETRYENYNSRRALHSKITGEVDGVKTKTELLIFKKNECLYILTLVGVAERFADDEDTFRKFVGGFKVQ